MFLTTSERSNYRKCSLDCDHDALRRRRRTKKKTQHVRWSTYISVFTDEPQNHVYTDEGSRSADARAAVRDYWPRAVHVPHVGNEREQLLGLRWRPVVRPSRVVEVSYSLDFIGLREEEL